MKVPTSDSSDRTSGRPFFVRPEAWKQERPAWCPHQDCVFCRRSQDALCGGRLPKPEPHDGDENTHRFCINADGVFPLQVNKTDLGYFRWIFDALDGETTSWLSKRPDAAPLLPKDEEARLASILVPALKVSPGPDAAPPEEKHNLPGVSRPNYCPDGAAHSWDSDGDEWRCSFCPAVFRAPPPSDAAQYSSDPRDSDHVYKDGVLQSSDAAPPMCKCNEILDALADGHPNPEGYMECADKDGHLPDCPLHRRAEGSKSGEESLAATQEHVAPGSLSSPPSDAAPVAEDWEPTKSFADIAAKFPNHPWEVTDDQGRDYRVDRVAPTVDGTLIIWVTPLYTREDTPPAEWRKIPEWSYEVSLAGEVRRAGQPKPLRQYMRDRYLGVALYSDNKGRQFHTHRLVATAFVPNPKNKPEVNHKNGDHLDNRAANLEWVTRGENVEHNLRDLGARGYILDYDKAEEVRRLHSEGMTRDALAAKYGVAYDTIRDILTDRTWLAHPEDAPGGPQWEGLARMMYGSLTCQHRACFFCGRTVGHEDDCQWDALDRLKGEET